MTDFLPVISHVIALALGGGIGWYIRGRGMTGVKIDLDNAKKEITDLKSKLIPAS